MMLKLAIAPILATLLILASQPANACTPNLLNEQAHRLLSDQTHTTNLMSSQSLKFPCTEIKISIDAMVNEFMALDQESVEMEETYWQHWGIQTTDDPLFTEEVGDDGDSFMGFGIWLPNELMWNGHYDQMSGGDKLFAHGVQLSMGFGEKKKWEPRMRLDYRWHEKYDDMMVQIEMPF